MAPLRGWCLCGDIKVEVLEGALPLTVLVCHCNNCRTTAGSTASLVAVVKNDSLKILEGDPKNYIDKATDSGNESQRFFCGRCGTPIYTEGPSRPGKVVVKLGLFASNKDYKWPAPRLEQFNENRNEWETPIASAADHQYTRRAMPPPAFAK